MKKIFTILFILTVLFVPSISDAQQKQQGDQESGVGVENAKAEEVVQAVQNQVGTTNLQQNVGDEQKGVNESGAGLDNTKSGQAGLEQQNQKAVSRRSRVANAIQEMERIATRNRGIGERVRVIAQNQNQNQEEAENALVKAQKRGDLARFFIGPNYGQLKNVEERLQNCTQNLSELKELKEQVQIQADRESLAEQIEIMEQVKQEIENEVVEDKKGFAIFGWLAKLAYKIIIYN